MTTLHIHIVKFYSQFFMRKKMLKSKHSIRICLLYEYSLAHTATEATRNLCQTIGPGTINQNTAYIWFERFDEGEESLEDEPR